MDEPVEEARGQPHERVSDLATVSTDLKHAALTPSGTSLIAGSQTARPTESVF